MSGRSCVLHSPTATPTPPKEKSKKKTISRPKAPPTPPHLPHPPHPPHAPSACTRSPTTARPPAALAAAIEKRREAVEAQMRALDEGGAELLYSPRAAREAELAAAEGPKGRLFAVPQLSSLASWG